MTVETIVSKNNTVLAFEKTSVASTCLVNLSTAFDCISHNMLSSKLQFHGIKNHELKVIVIYKK